MLIRLDCGDDLVELRDLLRSEDVSGGISNVTRQYDGKRRSSRICSVVNVLSEPFMVWTPDLVLRRSDAWQRGGAGVLAAPHP